MIQVAVVEDQRDIREALAHLLNQTKGFACTGAFADAESACGQLPHAMVDVVLLDVTLPGMSGIDAIPILRKQLPDTAILMLTVHEEDDIVFQALCAGATGYLLKTTEPAKILSGIKDVHSGGAPMTSRIARMVIRSFQRPVRQNLTPREKEIVNYLCAGHSYKSIALQLQISKDTVHAHLKNVYRKLEVNSMSEAVLKAIQERIV